MEKGLIIAFCLVFVAVSGDIAQNEKLNSVTEGSEDGSKMPAVVDKFLAGLPDINEGDDMFREKCFKTGNNESFDNAMEARSKFGECVTGLVDIKKLKAEIEAAKPTGDLDTVFKNYCHKTPILKSCVQDLLNGYEGCLLPEERVDIKVIQNITDSLMNFVCFKEGDRIALFIAEGGPECLDSKKEKIGECVNATVNNAKNDMNLTSEEIPIITFDEEKCGYFTEVQQCVVKVLEDCSEPTPANIVGSLFDFVRKSTPCKQYVTQASTGSSMVFSIMSIIVPLGAIILSKL